MSVVFSSTAGCAKLDANQHVYTLESRPRLSDYAVKTPDHSDPDLLLPCFLKVCSSEIKCGPPVALQHLT